MSKALRTKWLSSKNTLINWRKKREKRRNKSNWINKYKTGRKRTNARGMRLKDGASKSRRRLIIEMIMLSVMMVKRVMGSTAINKEMRSNISIGLEMKMKI